MTFPRPFFGGRRRVGSRAAMRGLTLFVALVLVTALALLLGLTLRPAADPLLPVPLTAPHFESISYGIQAFLWWDSTLRTFDLEMVRIMNFSHVKQIFGWEDIEPEPGDFTWDIADEVVEEVAYRGLQLVARMDHPPAWAIIDPASRADGVPFNVEAYGNFCGQVAARYQGRIAAYQVWNEPNLQREWAGHPPVAAGYVALLRACYTAIKAADPAAIVISAGLAPTGTDLPVAVPDERYLQEMYNAGLRDVYDVLGLHAPGYMYPPEVSSEQIAAERDGHRFWGFRHVEDMRQIMIANGEAHKQVAILEMGWNINPGIDPNYAWYAVDEPTQADYLVRAYRYAVEHWRPWVGLMSMIYIGAPGWTEQNEEYWWAVTVSGYGDDYQVRQGYIDLANMEKVTGERVIPARAPDSDAALGYEPLPEREE